MQLVLLFPGQGTQRPGMLRMFGLDLERTNDIFEVASQWAGKDIKDLCLNGTEQELKQTENTQFAVTAMNLCYLRILQDQGIKPDVVLGHSLGQYSALYAAGVISLNQLFCIIKKRVECMQEVTADGALCTVLGLELPQIESICKMLDPTGDNLSVALQNTKTQIVVGGTVGCMEKAETAFKNAKALRIVPVRVSKPFHTPLMRAMEEPFSAFINSLNLSMANCSLILNCKGVEASSVNEVRNDMKVQSTHMIRWYDSLLSTFRIAGKSAIYAECGVGKTLSGMLRSVCPGLPTYQLSQPKHLQTVIEQGKRV